MHNNHRTNSFQRSKSHNFRRGGSGGFSGGSRFPKRAKTPYINPELFVNKAQTVEEAPVAEPKNMFKDFEIADVLKNNIIRKGYTKPTPIQDQTIPYTLQGRDVLGIANTGTGKTAAFAVPLIDKIWKNRAERALIMAPTRELATQISDEIRSFTVGMGIYNTIVIGGASIHNQIYQLRRNPHIIIGTPGRIKDLIERKVINLAQFKSVVLDEMDRMLDMGFIHDIKHILSFLPQQRQTLFFSATITREIDTLINNFLKDPIKISVKIRETPVHIEQSVVVAPDDSAKLQYLVESLGKSEFNKVIIFGRTKRRVEKLSLSLAKEGLKVGSIHGDKPQSKRLQVLTAFKRNALNILVATDVASRGIDVNDITHVINYDQPNTYEDYVHRIGRTGRANKTGIAITFVERPIQPPRAFQSYPPKPVVSGAL